MTADAIAPSPAPQRRLFGWLPVEVPWLVGAGLLFHFLAQVRWDQKCEGFAYDPILRWWLPLVFFVAALYVGLGAVPRPQLRNRVKLNPQWLIELALPLMAVWYLKYVQPIYYVDDAGFILRYLDHFAEGCFYCFNVQDGPVFGISSFIYGLLAGFLTWSHIFNPEGALNFLTYVGVFCMGFLFIRILRQLIASDGAVILLWTMLMTCSLSLALIGNSGMEAPVHLSIVLAGLLFFLQGKDRLMWFFLALSVISKLDAVPLVIVVGTMWTVTHWKDLTDFDWHKRRYRDALAYGLLPVLIWIGFAILVFGSPLPQSAYAKVVLHHHAKGSWFPFLEGLINSAYQSIFLAVALVLFVAHVGFVVARKQGGRSLVFGFGFVATMLLYYFYNPAERMLWYYVLPEGLMLLQLCTSLHWAWTWLPDRKAWAGPLIGVCLCLGFAFMFTWMHTAGEIAYHDRYKHVVEGERIRIGEYLQARMQPEDTLQSGHGLTSRPVRGYVVDETGLNFRFNTTLEHKNKKLWEAFKPDWIVMHGYDWEIDKLNEFPYMLDTSFFDITLYQYPTWRVFKKVENMDLSEGTYSIHPPEILGDSMEVFHEGQHFEKLKAKAFSFVRSDYNPRESKITFGLLRHQYDYKVHVRDVLAGDTLVWRHTYIVPGQDTLGNAQICPITIPLLRHNIPKSRPQGTRYIILELEGSYGKAMLYDPMISILRSDPR